MSDRAAVAASAVAPRITDAGRPGPLRAWLTQVRYANRQFWRSVVAAFFTLAFPLICLVVITALFGNPVVDESSGLHLAQYLTPVFAVFGAAMASYMSVASIVAYARASGVLKRLRGTPTPPAAYVLGRMGSAVWVSGIATVVVVSTGVVVYDVQIIWANVPALVLTFLVGTACLSALGLAVAGVAPTPSSATAFANLTLILLSFVSGIFGAAELPTWLDRIASALPLKPFADAFSAGFDPAADATSPDWAALAVLAGWAVVGGLIVWRSFGWEPRTGGAVRRRGSDGVAGLGSRGDGEAERSQPDPAPSGLRWQEASVAAAGSPSLARLVSVQTRYALVQIRRDTLALFFAVIFPVLLLVYTCAVSPDDAQWEGLPLAQYLAPALSVYGLAISGVLNIPSSIAEHRAQGTLKRLRGTPMPRWAYLGGRVLAVVVYGLLTVALVFAAGAAAYDVTLSPSAWLVTIATFVLAIVCFAACGLALVAILDQPRAVTATALALVLPLSFISGIFIQVEQMPTVLDVISWVFPLRHAAAATVVASSGGALDRAFWEHVVVLLAWTLATALVAWRWFRWEPRAGRG